MKLQDVMHDDVPTTSPDETATAAWERMRALAADHLVVTKGTDIVGIVSWDDLSGPLGGKHRRMGRRVGDLMRRDVVTSSPGTSVARAAASMRASRVGCLPIVQRHKLVGIVTISDMLGILARGSKPPVRKERDK
jgi:acetoin utilization protein AcuB